MALQLFIGFRPSQPTLSIFFYLEQGSSSLVLLSSVYSLPSQKNKIVKGYPKAWGNCNLPLRFKFCVIEILKFLSYAVTESLHLETPIVPTSWHLFELILSTFHLPDIYKNIILPSVLLCSKESVHQNICVFLSPRSHRNLTGHSCKIYSFRATTGPNTVENTERFSQCKTHTCRPVQNIWQNCCF